MAFERVAKTKQRITILLAFLLGKPGTVGKYPTIVPVLTVIPFSQVPEDIRFAFLLNIEPPASKQNAQSLFE